MNARSATTGVPRVDRALGEFAPAELETPWLLNLLACQRRAMSSSHEYAGTALDLSCKSLDGFRCVASTCGVAARNPSCCCVMLTACTDPGDTPPGGSVGHDCETQGAPATSGGDHGPAWDTGANADDGLDDTGEPRLDAGVLAGTDPTQWESHSLSGIFYRSPTDDEMSALREDVSRFHVIRANRRRALRSLRCRAVRGPASCEGGTDVLEAGLHRALRCVLHTSRGEHERIVHGCGHLLLEFRQRDVRCRLPPLHPWRGLVRRATRDVRADHRRR